MISELFLSRLSLWQGEEFIRIRKLKNTKNVKPSLISIMIGSKRQKKRGGNCFLPRPHFYLYLNAAAYFWLKN